ncbi:hypothetical protein HDU96_008694 [Phlyctochytrium bullatum]|nr:hypothetical protein HDU96_008694 [Phlyctochytrium bullatum]
MPSSARQRSAKFIPLSASNVSAYASHRNGDGDDDWTAVPEFKIVSSSKTQMMLFGGFGAVQLVLTLFVVSILSSAAIFTQSSPNPENRDQLVYHRDCLLYMSFVKGTAPLGACIWPAVVAGFCALAVLIVTGRDLYLVHRVPFPTQYPSPSRISTFAHASTAAVAAFLMALIGIQIAIGLASACRNVASQTQGFSCRDAFDMLGANRDLVASGAVASFLSAGVWAYYSVLQFKTL